LQRTQDLLKQQVDIDRENNDLILAEIRSYGIQIEEDKKRTEIY